MKDPNIILVTVKAKQLKFCTPEELKADSPVLVDENGIEYKQIVEQRDESKDVIQMPRAERRKKK